MNKIKSIYWRNKIAVSTINLAPGDKVTEIEVFELKLEEYPLDESVLRQIDREVPYHIVFLLEHHGKYQVWTSYKELAVGGKTTFKVDSYFHTDWLVEDEFSLSIEGLSLDDAYENYVRRIAGSELSFGKGETLKESVDKSKLLGELEKKKLSLQTKIKNEKQFNRQIKLNDELKKTKEIIEKIKKDGK